MSRGSQAMSDDDADWYALSNGLSVVTECGTLIRGQDEEAEMNAVMTPRFRKKPVEIEAVKWNGATIGLTNGEPNERERLVMPTWLPPAQVVGGIDTSAVKPGEVYRCGDVLYIGTLEGCMAASPGDWIIHGVKGEIYPCKPGIFDVSYDRIE